MELVRSLVLVIQKFEGPFGAEVGEGLGLEALGIGLAARKSVSINSENTISMQYMFTVVALTIGDGLQFDQKQCDHTPI